MTLEDCIEKFTTEYLPMEDRSPNTINGYSKDLKCFNSYIEEEFNGPINADEITREDIENFILYLRDKKKYAPRSCARSVATLKSFFKYLSEHDIIAKNPASAIRSPRLPNNLPTYLTKEEVEKILSFISDKIAYTAIATMFFTGMRVGEVENLKLEDVDLSQMIIKAYGKGRKSRIIPVSKKLKDILCDYLKVRPKTNSNYFFACEKTGKVSRSYLSYWIKYAAKKAGINKKISCHTFRHSFATRLYKNGVDLKKISALLGHASLRTTEIYTHLDSKDLKNVVELI